MKLSRFLTLVLISGTVLLISLVAVFLFRQAARQALWEQQGQQARSVATSIAVQIDGDKHELLLKTRDQDLYDELLQPLLEVHKRLPSLYYVYTLTPQQGGDIFVLDTATEPAFVSHGRELEASAIGDPSPDYEPIHDQAMRGDTLWAKLCLPHSLRR